MKFFRKIGCLALALLLVASLSACSFRDAALFVMVDILGKDPDAAVYQLDPSGYVVFNKEENGQGNYIPAGQIDSYKSQYADCMGSWYYQQLNSQERRIYNAYLYAMEHCFKGFSLYLPEEDPEVGHIRAMVALDSPFLEQNVREKSEIYKTWKPTQHGTRVYFHAEWFAKEHWDLKMQALEACKKIVQEIPQKYDTQEEKMLYLYHYVCDQITYAAYEDAPGQDYLYDAACEGRTNCDGYSNMLLLLYRLTGVEACEIMGGDEKDSKKEGHTWVAAKLGDQFYHFDATYEDTGTEFVEDRTIYFGVSDEMVSSKIIDYEDIRPQCDDTSRDFAFAELEVDNIKKEKEIKAIAKLTDKRAKEKKYITYILVNDSVDSKGLDKMLDSYVKKVNYVKRVHASAIEIMGKSVLKVTTEPW